MEDDEEDEANDAKALRRASSIVALMSRRNENENGSDCMPRNGCVRACRRRREPTHRRTRVRRTGAALECRRFVVRSKIRWRCVPPLLAVAAAEISVTVQLCAAAASARNADADGADVPRAVRRGRSTPQ